MSNVAMPKDKGHYTLHVGTSKPAELIAAATGAAVIAGWEVILYSAGDAWAIWGEVASNEPVHVTLELDYRHAPKEYRKLLRAIRPYTYRHGIYAVLTSRSDYSQVLATWETTSD